MSWLRISLGVKTSCDANLWRSSGWMIFAMSLPKTSTCNKTRVCHKATSTLLWSPHHTTLLSRLICYTDHFVAQIFLDGHRAECQYASASDNHEETTTRLQRKKNTRVKLRRVLIGWYGVCQRGCSCNELIGRSLRFNDFTKPTTADCEYENKRYKMRESIAVVERKKVEVLRKRPCLTSNSCHDLCPLCCRSTNTTTQNNNMQINSSWSASRMQIRVALILLNILNS